jgi:hypothetical protein
MNPLRTDGDEPAEVFSLAECIYDELVARGWKTENAAVRMGTERGAALDLFMLDLLLCVPEEKFIIPDDIFAGLGRAFDVDPIFFKRINEQWHRYPDRRNKFEAPDDIFGPTSRRQSMHVAK